MSDITPPSTLTDPCYQWVPEPLALLTLNDSERQLANWIRRNGRVSVGQVAAELGISTESAQAQINALVEQGVLTQVGTVEDAIAPTYRRSRELPDLLHHEHTRRPKPLSVILSPAGGHTAAAGDTVEVNVTVHNQGDRSAIMDVYIADVSQTVLRWCSSPFERLALDPGQSAEVSFSFTVPIQTLPGFYSYSVMVDAPKHYPEDTPIDYAQQFQITPQFGRSAQFSDPTFTVYPVSRSTQPLPIPPGGILEATLTVHNRSNRVDRFRLTCPDLDPSWYTVSYPAGIRNLGLALSADALELNPNDQGEIHISIRPPSNTLAGLYTPTLRLYSANNPDLVLLDLLYIEVLPIYLLTAELQTLVSKVSQQPGFYWVRLVNTGNTTRELLLKAYTLDEEADVCRYRWKMVWETNGIQEATPVVAEGDVYNALPLRVLPYQTATIGLEVMPLHKRQRPFFGIGRMYQFVVELQDIQALPLGQTRLQSNLLWKPRPWWHWVLPILIALGAITVVAFLLWLALRPSPPPEIEQFAATEPSYDEASGDAVRLNWQISQPQRIGQLTIVGKSPDTGAIASLPISYDFSDGIPAPLQPFCVVRQQLVCRNVLTDARKPGNYVFELQMTPQRRGHSSARSIASSRQTERTDPVAIAPIPDPTIAAFESVLPRYITPVATEAQPISEGDRLMAPPIRLNWQIAHPQRLQQVVLIGRDADDAVVAPKQVFDFSQGIPAELAEFCQFGAALTCRNVPTGVSQPGNYRFELQVVSQSGAEDTPDPISKTTDTIKIEQPAVPFGITAFEINGATASVKYVIPVNRDADPPEPLQINWSVVGGSDLTVQLLPAPGTVPNEGAIAYPIAAQAGSETLTLVVTNGQGQQVSRSVTIEVVDETPATPLIIPAAPVATTAIPATPPTPLPPIAPLPRSPRSPAATDPTQLSPLELPPRLN